MRRFVSLLFGLMAVFALAAPVAADSAYAVYADHCTGPTGFSSHLILLPVRPAPPVIGSTIYFFGDTCTVAVVFARSLR